MYVTLVRTKNYLRSPHLADLLPPPSVYCLLTAACLFAAHPIHSEAVASKGVGRAPQPACLPVIPYFCLFDCPNIPLQYEICVYTHTCTPLTVLSPSLCFSLSPHPPHSLTHTSRPGRASQRLFLPQRLSLTHVGGNGQCGSVGEGSGRDGSGGEGEGSSGGCSSCDGGRGVRGVGSGVVL